MSTSIATVGFTVKQITKPQGAIPAGYMVWLTKNNATQYVENIGSADRSAQFAVDVPGTYLAHVVRLEASGGSIGSSVTSDPFVVPEASVEVPAVVTVSVGNTVALPNITA